MDEREFIKNKRIAEYDIEALRKNIEKCNDNIKIFEKAIRKEEETKRYLRSIIKTLEEKYGSTG